MMMLLYCPHRTRVDMARRISEWMSLKSVTRRKKKKKKSTKAFEKRFGEAAQIPVGMPYAAA